MGMTCSGLHQNTILPALAIPLITLLTFIQLTDLYVNALALRYVLHFDEPRFALLVLRDPWHASTYSNHACHH